MKSAPNISANFETESKPSQSKIERPEQWRIDRFKPGMAGRDTVGDFIGKGFSLVICCKACPRVEEWTPAELERRFGDRSRVKVADLAERLSCKGEGGCGSEEVAVFPNFREGG